MPAQKHPHLKPPQDSEVPIWRYMDFTKYVSMLENGGLFFSRSDKLNDPFEGSYSKGNKRFRDFVYKGEIPPKAFEQMAYFSEWVRQWTMINCWHMNQQESAAMWKIYAQTNEAIAIKSTYNKLFNLLDNSCFVAVVQYIDYETDWLPEGNSLYPYTHKRLSFTHEQELRAIIQDTPSKNGVIEYTATPPQSGVWKFLDLSSLIDCVYVAPACPSWYKELVESVSRRYNMNKVIIQSSLDDKPIF